MFSGIRQGELLGLSWDNIDFKNRSILIDRQLQCHKDDYYFNTPKNRTSRTIIVAPVVLEALQKEKKHQEKYRNLLGDAWNNPYNLVFTNEFDKNLVRRTVVKHYKNILAQAGLEENRFHDLRHNFAVNSIQAGDNIKIVQANLGHATSAFTLDVYCHAFRAMGLESAANMQQFYENLKPQVQTQ